MHSLMKKVLAISTASTVLILSSPVYAGNFSISCQVQPSADVELPTAKLTVTGDPLKGTMSYRYADDEQTSSGSIGRNCHPTLGGSSMAFTQAGTGIPTLVLKASGLSICRATSWTDFKLELVKDWQKDAYIVRSFAVVTEISFDDPLLSPPEDKPKLNGAICVIAPQN